MTQGSEPRTGPERGPGVCNSCQKRDKHDGVSNLSSPSHITEGDIRAAADEATTLLEVQRELRVERRVARQLLDERDMLDNVGKVTAKNFANQPKWGVESDE